MQTQFVFRHMDSSDALRNYAEERLSKIKRYFADPLKVNCTFAVEKIHHIVQFDVTLRNGLQLHSSEKTENMYSSIDMALAKMERQVRRYKDRITAHKPQKGRTARVRQSEMAADAFDDTVAGALLGAEAPVHGSDTPAFVSDAPTPIVREKEFRADRLAVRDAVMQLNLLQKQFLVFTNMETGDINVVYRLDDSGYGLIETRGHVDD
jgi:putative sigma-54 modulation protein